MTKGCILTLVPGMARSLDRVSVSVWHNFTMNISLTFDVLQKNYLNVNDLYYPY